MVAPPTGFDMDYGFSIFRSGNGEIYTDYDPLSTLPFTPEEATAIYYVAPTGSDGNPGTSPAAPFRSIGAAVNGRTGMVLVYVAPGEYFGDNSWRDRSPACDLIIRRNGEGRILASQHNVGVSWALTSGRTNTYQSTITSVSVVVDATNVNGDGDAVRMTPVATIDLVEATPGSYLNSGGITYVHTFDSRVPDSNIWPMMDRRNGRYHVNGGRLWVEGVDFYSGRAPFHATVTTDTDQQCYFTDCSFKYATGSLPNGFAQVSKGLTIMHNCVFSMNIADGANYHKHGTFVGPPRAIEIGCVGRSNGWNASGTNNGSTVHDAGSVVRVNSQYYANENRNIHDINESKSWNVGCVSRDSRGPSSAVNWASGTGTDSTQMWLDTCLSEGGDFDYEALFGATIYTYNCVDIGREVSGSNVQPYSPT